MSQNVPPGWYPDPENPSATRWWDGSSWAQPMGQAPGAQQSVARWSPTGGQPYGAQPYGGQAYGVQPYGVGFSPERDKAMKRSTAALVLGIVSIVTCWIPLLYLASSLAGGIVAIVFGRGAREILANDPTATSERSRASIGATLGIVGTTLAVINMIAGVIIQMSR